MRRLLAFAHSKIAGSACGLAAILAVTACSPAPPAELSLLSPELRNETQPSAGQAVDVSQAGSIAPVITATLRHQSAIASAAERVKSRFANVSEEQSGYYPQLSAGLVSDVSGGDATPQLRVTGTQMLYDFGRTGRGVSRQVMMARKAHLDFLGTVDEEVAVVLRLLAQQASQSRQRGLIRDRLSRMVALRSQVESRNLEGVTTASGLIEAQRRVQTAETLLARIELELASTARDIAAQTGQASAPPVPSLLQGLRCGVAAVDVDATLPVRKAQVDVAIAELDATSAGSARLPTLLIEAVSNHDISDLTDRADVGVNLRVNTDIFRGGALRSRQQAAARGAAAAEAAVAAARQSIQRDISHAQDTIAAQRVLSSSLRAQSALLDQTRDLYFQQFVELGTMTLDDVLTAEEEYHQTLLDLELADQDMTLAQIDCLLAEGNLRRFIGVEDTLLHGLALRQ